MNQEFRDAAIYGDFDTVTKFLETDPSLVSERDEYGFTALHEVAGEHYVKMVELLIANGADVNAKNDSGITPLHLAAYEQNVQLLIDNGAMVNVRSDLGETPLYLMASEEDGFESMAALLANGADPNMTNCDGETPLQAAQSTGEEDKVELIQSYIK